MDLSQRGCGKGIFVKALKELFRLFSKLVFELGANEIIVHRRNGRLDDRENIEDLHRKEIAAHAQHLNQLQECAAEFVGAFHNLQRVLEMQIKPLLLFFIRRLEGLFQGVPGIAAADRSRKRADLKGTLCPTLGQGVGGFLGGHGRETVYLLVSELRVLSVKLVQ